ncbi:MAG: hypothetical protein A3F78_12725 [Burkholderiales bacterium RIFCSPLOWO2_12_FULL_61_40]|nr:MAG: hypothetical protein A3F78_12725 [Burkholderiales bacterium RIFCSPLOWO2_12_FULL_61_40]
MSISPFFRTLRSAYQAEIDDLTFDSEGKDVLRQRLAQRRKELPFLLQMLELSPEMVSVIFHQGFRFKLPAAMDHLVSHASEDLPVWDSLADTITMAPWAQELAKTILKEPLGEWFLSVAAGLEYLYGKPDRAQVGADDGEDHENEENEDGQDDSDGEDDGDERAGEEAGADWMVEQGFDRKD